MSLFSRIAGVLSSFFQFGGPAGSGLNNNGGVLEAKESTNTTLVKVRTADPVGLTDVVTLGSLSNSAASPVKTFGRFEYWGGTTNGATLIQSFCNCILGQSGTCTTPIAASTSLLTSTKRTSFGIGIAGGAITCGVFDLSGRLDVWRGNAAGLGGFNLRLKFGTPLAPTGSLSRMLAGLIAQSGSGAAQDWTTQLGIASIGVGFTQTPAGSVWAGNWKLIHSVGDGATPPTVLDLGATMPVNLTDLYQLDLFCAPNGANITVTLTNLTTGNVSTTVVAANFPASATFMAMWCACAFGAGATSAGQLHVAEYAYQQNN
jgi:hypothetical protein